MKSLKLITGAFMLFAVATMNAQDEADNSEDKTISFGVKGGVNFSTAVSNEDDFDSPKSRTSFHVGGVVEMPITDMFSIQAEAVYSGQGYELRFAGPDGDTAEVQLDYINVPILAKFYLTLGLLQLQSRNFLHQDQDLQDLRHHH